MNKKRKLSNCRSDAFAYSFEDDNIGNFRNRILAAIPVHMESYFMIKSGISHNPRLMGSKRRPKDYFIRVDFNRLLPEEKIQRMLYYKDDPSMRSQFSEFLSKGDTSFLRSLFKEKFRQFKRVKVSKDVMVQSLISYFYQEEAEICKREIEEGNLDEIKDFRDLQSVVMTNKYINVDIIVHIMSFMKYDSVLLFEIGATCKAFYFTILSNWPILIVNNLFLRQISLLVLRNIRVLKIIEEEKEKEFTKDEFEYLLKNLSNKRLQRVTFRCDRKNFQNKLRMILKYVDKDPSNENPFLNVRELRFSLCDKTDPKCYKFGRFRVSQSVKSLFPKLEKFEHPIVLEWIEGIPLVKIRIKRRSSLVQQVFERYRWSPMFEYKFYKGIERVICVKNFPMERIKKFVSLNRLRVLEYGSGDNDTPRFFQELFGYLKNSIEKLVLSINQGTDKLDYLKCLSILSNLEEVEIKTIYPSGKACSTWYDTHEEFNGIRWFGNQFYRKIKRNVPFRISLESFSELKNLKSVSLILTEEIDLFFLDALMTNHTKTLKNVKILFACRQNHFSKSFGQALSKTSDLDSFHCEIKIMRPKFSSQVIFIKQNQKNRSLRLGCFYSERKDSYSYPVFKNYVIPFVKVLISSDYTLKPKTISLVTRDVEMEQFVRKVWGDVDSDLKGRCGYKKSIDGSKKDEEFSPANLEVNRYYYYTKKSFFGSEERVKVSVRKKRESEDDGRTIYYRDWGVKIIQIPFVRLNYSLK